MQAYEAGKVLSKFASSSKRKSVKISSNGTNFRGQEVQQALHFELVLSKSFC